jgi:hypothetical protein
MQARDLKNTGSRPNYKAMWEVVQLPIEQSELRFKKGAVGTFESVCYCVGEQGSSCD